MFTMNRNQCSRSPEYAANVFAANCRSSVEQRGLVAPTPRAHHDLLRNGDLYAQLYRSQFREIAEPPLRD